MFLLPAAAFGEDPPDGDTKQNTQALWEMRLAAFGRYGAAYPASEDDQANLIPLPLPVYRGRFLRLGDDTENPIRGRIFRADRIKLDLDFDLNFPVDSEDIDARTGMPDLDLLLEAGPELELEFARAPLNGGFFSRPATSSRRVVRRTQPGLPWPGFQPGTEVPQKIPESPRAGQSHPRTNLRHTALYELLL